MACQFNSSPDAFVRLVGVCPAMVITGDAMVSKNVNERVIRSPGFAKEPAVMAAVEFVLLELMVTAVVVGTVLSKTILGVGSCDVPALPARSVNVSVDAIAAISSSEACMV